MNLIYKHGIFVVLLASVHPFSARADVFSNKDGKLIEAEIVSYDSPDADRVRMRTGDREVDVELSYFSEASQKQIRNWMKENPPKEYEHRFEITGTKTADKERYAYDLKLRNLAGNDLPGLRIDYLVFMENSMGKPVSKGDSLAIEKAIGSGKTVSFSTKPFDPDVMTTANSTSVVSVRTSSSRARKSRQSLLGVLMRAYDLNGNLVVDWRSPGCGDSLKWPDSKKDASKNEAYQIE